MPTLKLTYFDAPGRAEPVRLALRIAGIPFEDHRLKFPEFAALKADGAFPLGSVPILEVDGHPITQTAAMLRYAARAGQGDLYPTDPTQALVVDSALDTFNDTLSNALLPSLYEREPDKKLAMRKVFAAGPLPLACRYVEGLIARGDGPFLIGPQLTIADLVLALQVAQIQRGGLDGIDAAALDPFPRLVGLAGATLSDPRVVAARG
jgi:prostaglandin-H2 D-isomerase / glutathione transferase